MKVEFADVSETRKRLTIEIPSETVDAEIDRLVARLGRSAQGPGLPPGQGAAARRLAAVQGRDPARRGPRPGAARRSTRRCASAASSRSTRPTSATSWSSRGQPLTFTATFDDVPAFDPGDYRGSRCASRRRRSRTRRWSETLERLRQRAARFEPVEGRPLEADDWATVDLDAAGERSRAARRARDARERDHRARRRRPTRPGSTSSWWALRPGAHKTFTVHYPADYAVKDLAGQSVEYTASRSRPSSSGWCRRWTTSSRRTWASSTRWRRCGTGCGATSSTRRRTRPTAQVRGDLLSGPGEAGAVRGARRRSSSASSTAGSRSSRGGWSSSRSIRARRASTGTSSGRPSATRRRSR